MGQTWCGKNKRNNIDEKIIEILFKNEVLFPDGNMEQQQQMF